MKINNNITKKVISMAMAAIMIASSVAVGVFATDSTYGKCGDNCTYNYNPNTNSLCISGSGRMYDYTCDWNSFPWSSFRDEATSITIGSNITSICRLAFYNFSKVESITIPNSVNYLGGGVFNACTNLKNVTIGNGISLIPNACFANCTSLKSVTIPENIYSINQSGFSDCSSLTNVTFESNENLYSIEKYAFEDTAISSINIPSSVEQIGYDAFAGTPYLDNQTAEFVTVGNGVLIDYNGAGGSVTIPETVKTLSNAFDYAENKLSVTDITLDSNLKTIEYRAFNGIHSETPVNMSKATKLEFIDEDAFAIWTEDETGYTIDSGKDHNIYVKNYVIPASAVVIKDKPKYDTISYYKGTEGEKYCTELSLGGTALTDTSNIYSEQSVTRVDGPSNDNFDYTGFETWYKTDRAGNDDYFYLECPEKNKSIEYMLSATDALLEQNIDKSFKTLNNNVMVFDITYKNDSSVSAKFENESNAINYYRNIFYRYYQASTLGEGMIYKGIDTAKDTKGKYYATEVTIGFNIGGFNSDNFNNNNFAKMNELLSATKTFSTNKYGQLYFLHNYFVYMGKYDSSDQTTVWYNEFVSGVGVCSTFAKKTNLLISLLGMKSVSGSNDPNGGDSGGHIYNLVQLGNSFITVDNTPVLGGLGTDIIRTVDGGAFGYVSNNHNFISQNCTQIAEECNLNPLPILTYCEEDGIPVTEKNENYYSYKASDFAKYIKNAKTIDYAGNYSANSSGSQSFYDKNKGTLNFSGIINPTSYDIYLYDNSGKQFEVIQKFNFSKIGINDIEFENKKVSYNYTGKAVIPAISSVSGTDKNGKNTTLTASDYTVSYKNNTNVGTGTVTVTGRGTYAGCSYSKDFTIKYDDTAKTTITNCSYKNGTAQLCWTAVPYVNNYKISFIGNEGNVTTTTTYLSWVTSGLTSTTNTFSITPVYPDGTTGKATTVKVANLPEVEVEKAAPTSKQVTIEVQKVPNADGYEVYDTDNKLVGSYTSANSDDGDTVSILATGLAYNKTQTVTIKTYALKNGIKYYSTDVAKQTITTKPFATTKVRCVGRTVKSIAISWNKVDEVSGYRIAVTDNATKKTFYKTTSADSVSYNITGLAAGHQYSIKVGCMDGTYAKNYSPVVKILARAPGKSFKKVTTNKYHKINVQWCRSGSDAVGGYQVQLCTNAKFNSGVKTITANGWNNYSRTFSGLKRGRRYYVRIRTFKNYKSGNTTKRDYGYWSKTSTIICK